VICCVGLAGLTVFAWTNRYSETEKISELVKENDDLKLQIKSFKSAIRYHSDVILGKTAVSSKIQERMRLLRAEFIKQGH
jgi:hypothetical protein